MFYASGVIQNSGPLIILPGGLSEATGGGTQTAGWRFNRDGTVDRFVNGSYTFAHNWFRGSDPNPGDNYEIRALPPFPDSWTVRAAPDNTWIGLTGDRLWFVQRTVAGFSLAASDFELRETGTTDEVTGNYSSIAEIIA